MSKPRTIRELKREGYKVLPVKVEMRKNLIEKMRKGGEFFPGIIGFDDTVIPQIQNAILSGQDMIFLGERGQAKTRLIRSLVTLLDEEVPAMAGCEINDHPYAPICKQCKNLIEEMGDDASIVWIPRDQRYGEKLATPDVTTPDLIGEIDPIKVAEGRYLSDELTLHYGLIPRTNRGIFCINELPDLSEKIQVGLFNIMEERDVQIRGFKVRLPLDVYLVASANPEDYTNRGRIITPLKDRYGSEVRTHYPENIDIEIQIMENERKRFVDDERSLTVPQFMKEIIAEVTNLARSSPDINQRSGVSVRMSISNYENLISSALKRGIMLGESDVVPRVSDLAATLQSTTGKIELEGLEEDKGRQLIQDLIKKAVKKVFDRYFKLKTFENFITRFSSGTRIEVSEVKPSKEYSRILGEYNELMDGVISLGHYDSAPVVASAIEFILEGLHLNKKLNKDELHGKASYRGQ